MGCEVLSQSAVCSLGAVMGSLAISRIHQAPVEDLAALSCRWDRVEACDAHLVVGVPASDALVLGAYQRSGERIRFGQRGDDLPVQRRGSGGCAVRVGTGTVWVTLALARPNALVPCTVDKLLNRYVRPLLRALTRSTSHPAHYFGRDWISVAHRPVALVAFAHDASTDRCLVEAIVAVSTPFALESRKAFLGKESATLESALGHSLNSEAVASAIELAYRELGTKHVELDVSPVPAAEPIVHTNEPEWVSAHEEAMGTIACGPDGRGCIRVGGELMASRDAVLRLEASINALSARATAEDVGRAVDDAFTKRGAFLFGIRSLTSIRDVIVEARAKTFSG